MNAGLQDEPTSILFQRLKPPRWHSRPVHRKPLFAMPWFQTIPIALSGRYNGVLDYVIFAMLLFYILTIGEFFRVRRTSSYMDGIYRAVGYPVLSALYMLVAGMTEVLLLRSKPAFTVRGLILILPGVPVYFLWRRKDTRNA